MYFDQINAALVGIENPSRPQTLEWQCSSRHDHERNSKSPIQKQFSFKGIDHPKMKIR